MSREHTCLLLVDVQPDFMAGGGLAVETGEEIVEPVAELVRNGEFGVIVATQDWHPAGHVSFASSHEGKEPMETIELYGHEQILWPDHCVQGTEKAELHEGLPLDHVDAIVRKGTDVAVDSYSAFRNNWNADGERPPTGLAGYLRERGIHEVVIAGLARDVCVKWTAEDAREAGFEVTLVWDLTRPVDPDKDQEVREGLEERGVKIAERQALVR